MRASHLAALRRTLPAVCAAALCACGASSSDDGGPVDGGADAPAVDAPAPVDGGLDLPSVDAGADLGDAGMSMCAALPTSLTCTGTMRTVMSRPYCIHVPPGYHDGTAIPVVLLLHGYTTTGVVQAGYLGLEHVADVRNFLLLEPDGLVDSLGQHYWNASPACCAMFATTPPDDVAYLNAVMDDVESAYTIDATREYVMGHSNGGFMTHRLGCESGARFAAGASLAGGANTDCTPTVPFPILEIHGDADATIMYGGGTNPGASVPYPSVDDTMTYWSTANGCTGTRRELETRELVCDTTDHETHVESYSGCSADVELWRMVGAGHIPLFREPDWPLGVVDFLFAHHR